MSAMVRISLGLLGGMAFAAQLTAATQGLVSHQLNTAISKGDFENITSLLVAHQGKTVLEAYWDGANPDTLHDTRSATKSLTAMAVGAAIADGYIADVNVPAFGYFSEQGNRGGRSEVTIKDLLTMTSALDCDDNKQSSPGNEGKMHSHRRWLNFVMDIPLKRQFSRGKNGLGPFSYCTAGSFLLGQIIEKASGEPVDQYIERRLFTPLGITQVHWDRSPTSEVQTGGGTELRSRDLLKLGELARTGGAYLGKKVLPEQWVDEMLEVHTKVNSEQGYGYQWWYRSFKCGGKTVSGWYMAGNGGSKIAVFDELDMTVVVTATHYGRRNMHEQTTRIIEAHILNQVHGCST